MTIGPEALMLALGIVLGALANVAVNSLNIWMQTRSNRREKAREHRFEMEQRARKIHLPGPEDVKRYGRSGARGDNKYDSGASDFLGISVSLILGLGSIVSLTRNATGVISRFVLEQPRAAVVIAAVTTFLLAQVLIELRRKRR